MSSVIDYIKCPQCGGIMHTDFDCNTTEEYRMCHRCGKIQSYTLKRDDNHKIIFDENKQVIWQEKDLDGNGCVCFDFGSIAQISSLENPVDDNIKKQFDEELKQNENLIKDKCYFTYWDNNDKKVKSYFGKIPELYDEEFGGESNG